MPGIKFTNTKYTKWYGSIKKNGTIYEEYGLKKHALPPGHRFKRGNMVGSKKQVWRGEKHHTSGGLTIKEIGMNKWGRLVSVRKHVMIQLTLRDPLARWKQYVQDARLLYPSKSFKSVLKLAKVAYRRPRQGGQQTPTYIPNQGPTFYPPNPPFYM